jgi:hypothetical protein
MVAYPFRMPSGIPGETHRIEHATIETQLLAATTFPVAYGLPVWMTTGGKVSMWIASGTGLMGAPATPATPYGWIVRPFPTGASNDGLNTSTPPTSGMVDILTRGYLNVKILETGTNVVRGGLVYVRNTTTSGAKILGGVQSTADSAAATAVSGMTYFMGAQDANGITEIAVNI